MFQSQFVVNSGESPEDSVHTSRKASRIGTALGHSATAGPALNPFGIGRRGGETLMGYRELDEAFALTEMVQDTFEESRISNNKQHKLVPCLRGRTCQQITTR